MGDGLTGLGIAHIHRKYAWPAKVEQWQAIEICPLSDLFAWAEKWLGVTECGHCAHGGTMAAESNP